MGHELQLRRLNNACRAKTKQGDETMNWFFVSVDRPNVAGGSDIGYAGIEMGLGSAWS